MPSPTVCEQSTDSPYIWDIYYGPVQVILTWNGLCLLSSFICVVFRQRWIRRIRPKRPMLGALTLSFSNINLIGPHPLCIVDGCVTHIWTWYYLPLTISTQRPLSSPHHINAASILPLLFLDIIVLLERLSNLGLDSPPKPLRETVVLILVVVVVIFIFFVLLVCLLLIIKDHELFYACLRATKVWWAWKRSGEWSDKPVYLSNSLQKSISTNGRLWEFVSNIPQSSHRRFQKDELLVDIANVGWCIVLCCLLFIYWTFSHSNDKFTPSLILQLLSGVDSCDLNSVPNDCQEYIRDILMERSSQRNSEWARTISFCLLPVNRSILQL